MTVTDEDYSKASSQPLWWLRSSVAISRVRADGADDPAGSGTDAATLWQESKHATSGHGGVSSAFTPDSVALATSKRDHRCLLLPGTNWECWFNPFCNDHLVKCHQRPSLAERQIAAGMSPGLLFTNPLRNLRSCFFALFVSLLDHCGMWFQRCCRSNVSRGRRTLTSPAGSSGSRRSASVTSDWRNPDCQVTITAPWTGVSKLIPIRILKKTAFSSRVGRIKCHINLTSLQHAGLLLHVGWLEKGAFSLQLQVTLTHVNTTFTCWQ